MFDSIKKVIDETNIEFGHYVNFTDKLPHLFFIISIIACFIITSIMIFVFEINHIQIGDYRLSDADFVDIFTLLTTTFFFMVLATGSLIYAFILGFNLIFNR